MRVAYFLTHPVQYQSPMIRSLVMDGVDLVVVYASVESEAGYHDEGYGRRVTWDVPLLEGYTYATLQKDHTKGSFIANLISYRRSIRKWLMAASPDVIWSHGWGNAFNLAALLEGNTAGIPVMIRGDSQLGGFRGGRIRRYLHRKLLWHFLLKRVDVFLAVGSANAEYYRTYGAKEEQIFMVPYAVDNKFFQERCNQTLNNLLNERNKLGIVPGRRVFLYVARLAPEKAPETLILAFAEASKLMPPEETPYLIIVGDGVLRHHLELLARSLMPENIKFLGFQNQTELPLLYALCDAMVLPSVFEPWGLVVNEVMNAGKAVVTSDKVGAARDLIRDGVNGRIFRAGDREALCQCLVVALTSPEWFRDAGLQSLKIINNWSFTQDYKGLQQALENIKNRRS